MLVACGYFIVAAMSAVLIFWRYMQYMTHPADAAAYGGMWAGGDLMLEWFIVGMLLVVTFFLVLVIWKDETAYTTYAKTLVGISLTTPLSVVIIIIPWVGQSNSFLGYACMFRLFASPLMALWMGVSRLFARFSRAKRLTVYASLIEGGTLLLIMLLLFSGIPGLS